jgi:CHAT domain
MRKWGVSIEAIPIRLHHWVMTFLIVIIFNICFVRTTFAAEPTMRSAATSPSADLNESIYEATIYQLSIAPSDTDALFSAMLATIAKDHPLSPTDYAVAVQETLEQIWGWGRPHPANCCKWYETALLDPRTDAFLNTVGEDARLARDSEVAHLRLALAAGGPAITRFWVSKWRDTCRTNKTLQLSIYGKTSDFVSRTNPATGHDEMIPKSKMQPGGVYELFGAGQDSVPLLHVEDTIHRAYSRSLVLHFERTTDNTAELDTLSAELLDTLPAIEEEIFSSEKQAFDDSMVLLKSQLPNTSAAELVEMSKMNAEAETLRVRFYALCVNAAHRLISAGQTSEAQYLLHAAQDLAATRMKPADLVQSNPTLYWGDPTIYFDFLSASARIAFAAHDYRRTLQISEGAIDEYQRDLHMMLVPLVVSDPAPTQATLDAMRAERSPARDAALLEDNRLDIMRYAATVLRARVSSLVAMDRDGDALLELDAIRANVLDMQWNAHQGTDHMMKSLAEYVKDLPKGSERNPFACIAFFAGTENIVTWLVSSNGSISKIGDMPRAATFDDLPALVRRSLDSSNERKSRLAAYTSLNAIVTQLLPASVIESLRAKGIRRLIIVPDAALWSVPWPCIRLNDTYLVQDFDLSIQFSVAAAFAYSNGTSVATGPTDALVIGGPAVSTSYEKLPWALREAEVIAGRLGTQPLVGSKATKNAVFSRLPHVNVAHFGQHAATNGYESWLALAGGSEDDGRLTGSQIRLAQSMPKLCSIAACDAATGPQADLEGVLSIVRSFRAAGNVSCIAPVGPASDSFTADLMDRFYCYLSKGDSIQALAMAQRSLSSSDAVPVQWGQFLAFGSGVAVSNLSGPPMPIIGSEIERAHRNRRWIGGAISAVVTIFTWVFIIRSRRNQKESESTDGQRYQAPQVTH